MNPVHHPSPDRLLEYAAGKLPPGQDLVISAHVAACGSCRAEVHRHETVAGALLEETPPAALANGALERVLSRLDEPAPRAEQVPGGVPADWIGFSSPAIEQAWRRRRWAAPGVWVSPIFRVPGPSSTYLLRVGAGMSVPFHRHRGNEFVTVLKGAFEDRGDICRAGDFAESDEAVSHKPTVTRDGECVCLINTDAPLIPLDWIGRIFQPLVRI